MRTRCSSVYSVRFTVPAGRNQSLPGSEPRPGELYTSTRAEYGSAACDNGAALVAVEAYVTPKVLRWARERDHLSAEQLAKHFKVSPSRVEDWEQGVSRPTFRQAERLAQHLNVPFGYLFLSQPPADKLPLPDLRTVGDQPPPDPSPELWDCVADAVEKQAWYHDYLEDEGTGPLEFVGRESLNNAPAELAAAVRSELGIDASLRATARSWEQFLALLIGRAEAAGILVLRNGVVRNNTHRPLDVSEFRGFAISDRLAPLVFINARDAKSAQIFTLAHELAHLWLGKSGISNPNYRERSESQPNVVERVCNRAAAELLLPKDEFIPIWEHAASVEEKVRAAAVHFRVSRLAALRQAFDLDLVDSKHYWPLYDKLLEEGLRVSGAGGNFYNSLLARNSPTLTKALFTAMAEGRSTYVEASRLLNVRASGLDALRERVLAGGE